VQVDYVLQTFQENVLVDENGRARIADFGLTVMLTANHPLSSRPGKSSTRWASPEAIIEEGEQGVRTTWTDVFSFGRILYCASTHLLGPEIEC
jgi:serine/threonine protein kinase